MSADMYGANIGANVPVGSGAALGGGSGVPWTQRLGDWWADPQNQRMLIQILGQMGQTIMGQGNPTQQAIGVPGALSAKSAQGQGESALLARALKMALDPGSGVSAKVDGQKASITVPTVDPIAETASKTKPVAYARVGEWV